MDFSIFINWITPFSFWVQLGDIYLFLKKQQQNLTEQSESDQ